MYVCSYVYMYVCIYVCMNECMHVCMYVCIYVSMIIIIKIEKVVVLFVGRKMISRKLIKIKPFHYSGGLRIDVGQIGVQFF